MNCDQAIDFADIISEVEAKAGSSSVVRLAATLGRISERALVPHDARLTALIDGLDEYDPPPGPLLPDPLAAFLSYALPAGVSVLCASRPRHSHVDALATRGELVQLDLDDAERFAADNDATVRAFWEQEASGRAFLRGAREPLVESRRMEGVPAYRLPHDSICAYPARAIGADAPCHYHHALAQKLATWPPVEPARGGMRSVTCCFIGSSHRTGLMHGARPAT